MRKILLLSAAGFVLQATPVLAENHGDYHGDKKAKMEEIFKETDTNADGQISRDEYMTHVQKRATEKFTEKDVDGDGNLTVEESKTYYESKKEDRREKMKERMEERKEKMMEKSIEMPEEAVTE